MVEQVTSMFQLPLNLQRSVQPSKSNGFALMKKLKRLMLKLWHFFPLIGYMYFQSKRVQNFLQDLMSILWEDQFPELQWNLKEGNAWGWNKHERKNKKGGRSLHCQTYCQWQENDRIGSFFGKEKSLKIAENQSQQKGKPFLRTANENTFCYVWQNFMKFQYI